MLSILKAARRIRGRVRRTPLVRSAWLSGAAGAEVWLKLECLQETHAFKMRGALNAVLDLCERRDAGQAVREVVTASTGNHGRALAEAARLAQLPCTVFTPRQAPRAKLEAIRAAGARLESVAQDCDEAEHLARDHAQRTGAVYISAYNHPAIVAGAGTIGLEILEDAPDVDVVVIPVGGGGLASGVATAVKTMSPACRTVGVEAAGNPAFRVARAHGAITPIVVSDSLADGLTGNIEPGAITFPLVERYVDDLVDVDEAQIARAVVALVSSERLVVEGAGAVAAAALASGALDVRGRRVVAIVSGANIDPETLASLIIQSQRRG
jgi:threonine dehydratase